jgi:hypothetical protein
MAPVNSYYFVSRRRQSNNPRPRPSVPKLVIRPFIAYHPPHLHEAL